MRTGSSSETESIASASATRSSSSSTPSSASETLIPMSRKTSKTRIRSSGTCSTTGKIAMMSSGLSSPCSRPLRIKAAAAATRPSLLEVVFELLAAARMPELAECLRLDLPDSFPRDPKSLPHLFQGSLMAVDQTETQLQHAALARRQCVEDVLYLRPQHCQRGRVRG